MIVVAALVGTLGQLDLVDDAEHAVIALIVPPLPAASLPSNRTMTLSLFSLTHSFRWHSWHLELVQLLLICLPFQSGTGGTLAIASIFVCGTLEGD